MNQQRRACSVWDVSCPECLVGPGEPCVSGYKVNEEGNLVVICSSIHEDRKKKAEHESNDLLE